MILPGARGLDYAFGRPTAESILRNGYTFVVRYISVPPASKSKNLSASERDMLLAAGIGILLVWEMSAATPDKGAPQGVIDGRNAAKAATTLGYPADLPILVAVDTDSYAGNILAHEQYVRAFAAVCTPYPIGVYGDADILLRIGKLSRIGWLPNASAWSSAKRAEAMAAGYIHVLQRKGYGMEGVAVDPNDVIQPIPVWSRQPVVHVEVEKPPTPPVVITPPTPAPTPQPQPEGDDNMVIITNREVRDGSPPGDLKWVLMDDGRLRPIDTKEWAARTGWVHRVTVDDRWGVAWDNAELDDAGIWLPAAFTVSPVPAAKVKWLLTGEGVSEPTGD